MSRSLAACQGALLLVDAARGVQAQTVANFFLVRGAAVSASLACGWACVLLALRTAAGTGGADVSTHPGSFLVSIWPSTYSNA